MRATFEVAPFFMQLFAFRLVGADDAVMLNDRGEVTTSNIYGVLRQPPLYEELTGKPTF